MSVKMLRRVAAVGAALAMTVGMAACGSNSSSTDSSKGKVYYLNTKPEVADQWKDLGAEYQKETGVQVDVRTSSGGDFQETLASELSKSEAPTMFNVAGYPEFVKFKKYLQPMNDTEPYKLLTDEGKTNAYSQNGKAYSVPSVVEYDGMMYNKKILGEYFKKPYAVAKSAKDMYTFEGQKKVIEDVQKHKGDLGIKAAVATPGLDSSGNWRPVGHPMTMAIAMEMRDANKTFLPQISGRYFDHFKDFFDLQVDNSPSEKSILTSKTNDDCVSEFALGDVAFMPDGTWADTQIKGNNVDEKDIGLLPLRMGIPGEEQYGVRAIYENQWGLNVKASKQDQKATLAFMKWCLTSEKGKKAMTDDMGFAVPSKGFGKEYRPDNAVFTEAYKLKDAGLKDIYNPYSPDQQWGDSIIDAITDYVQKGGSWSKVHAAFVDGWKTEWANNIKQSGMTPEAKPLNN